MSVEVIVDIRDIFGETARGDAVRVWSPGVREGSNGLVSSRPQTKPLVDGKATLTLEPGPVNVQFLPIGAAGKTKFEGVVPATGPVTLGEVIAGDFVYTPPVVQAGVQAIWTARDQSLAVVETAIDDLDTDVAEFKTKADNALTVAQNADGKSTTALAKSTTAEGLAGNAVDRVTALEAMGGLSPESPVDGQTANLIEQEDTLTRSAVDRAADVSMGARMLDTYGTKVYESEATGEVVTLADAPRGDLPISTALPSVSLAQVQSIDSAADLSDSADWYLLQSLINDCAARNVKDIKIPRGTYYMSRGLDLSGLDYGTYMDMSGVILRATKALPRMIWLEHRGNYWKGRRITVHGLEIRGRYLAQRGIDIEGVQEWAIDVRVHECYIGVALADTWYGKLSRETIIQDCLTGIAFLRRNTVEINTIGLDNVKINFAAPKSNFTLTPNADSIGIMISTILAGINFHTLVVESVDYGVKYIPVATGSGFQRGLVMFTGCYWENIKKKVFDFSDLSLAGYIHQLNSVIVRGNRFLAPLSTESVFGPGNHEITGNQKLSVRVVDSPSTRVTLRIDDMVKLTKYSTSPQVFIDRAPTVPTAIETSRFSPWGDKNAYPQGEGMLYTAQHAAYRSLPAADKIRARSGSPSKIFPTYSITTKPTTYYPSVGNNPNGPVMMGTDGWYMLLLGDGGALTTRKIVNTSRIDEGVDYRTGKELHYMTASEVLGTGYHCIDINASVILGAWGGQNRWVDTSGILRIGTMDELITQFSILPNGNRVFDIRTGQSAWIGTGVAYLYDWFGSYKNERVAGTLAQRPATPTDGLIYYDTDSGSYAKYTNGAWASFTPNVTT